MPQLDKFTFISQLCFLTLFYLGCYLLSSLGFLPRLFKILRFRANLFNNLKISAISSHISERELGTFSVSKLLNNIGVSVVKRGDRFISYVYNYILSNF